jgi:hypothetical protein
MRRVALAAGLIALAGAGLNVEAILPATSVPSRAGSLASGAPLTLTIYPPTTSVASTPSGAPPPPLTAAALLNLFATSKAADLDAILHSRLKSWLVVQASLPVELSQISVSPAAQGVLLLVAIDAGAYPVINAIAPLVSRLAVAAAHLANPAQLPGMLLTIERLARSAARLQQRPS